MNKTPRKIVGYAVLALASVLFIMPFLWMLSTSVKHESGIFPKPGEGLQWLPTKGRLDEDGRRILMLNATGEEVIELSKEDSGYYRVQAGGEVREILPEDFEPATEVGFHFQNYEEAFEMIDFFTNLRNTLFICAGTVLGTLLSSALVAYSFARIPWPGRDIAFFLVLATMMVPYQVTLIPLFVLYKNLGWTGTFKPLIIPYFFGVPFYIFLLRQFFKSIPQDLSSAARIDGCNEFGIFMRVVVPLAKPALATTALFMFLFQWGDFMNPLIFLQDDRQYTLALALQRFQSAHENLWGPLMAMSVVITTPVIALFFVTQRTFIEGITLTGLKG
jgi:multiple sugar transport system permease protein